MGPVPRLPRAQRREQLIEAAAGAFLEGGFDGTSMDDVARAAGVTRLIVYRVFDSKEDLYRSVLQTVFTELGQQFNGVDIEELRQLGTTKVLLPVARAQSDAFRLLWRHALQEPGFADVAMQFRRYVIYYAKEILAAYIVDDELLLEWAARSAGAHLIEGICTWLDVGDPARDEEFGELMTTGLRALAASWSQPRPTR